MSCPPDSSRQRPPPTHTPKVLGYWGIAKWGDRNATHSKPALDRAPAFSPPRPQEGSAIGGKFWGLWRLVREQRPRPHGPGAQSGLRRGVAGCGDAPGRAAAPRAARAAAPTLPGQQPEAPARPRAMPVAALLCALCCGLLAASARAGYSEDRCSWRGRYGPQEGLWGGVFLLVLGASLPLGTEEAQTSMTCATEWTQVLVDAGKGVSRLGEQGPPRLRTTVLSPAA